MTIDIGIDDQNHEPLTAVGAVLHPETAPPPPAPDANGEATACDEDPRDAEMRRMREAMASLEARTAQAEAQSRADRLMREKALLDALGERTKQQSKTRNQEVVFHDPESDLIWGNTIEDALALFLRSDHRWDVIDAGGGSKDLKGRTRSLVTAIAGRAAVEALRRFPDALPPMLPTPPLEGATGLDSLSPEWKDFLIWIGETETMTLDKRMAKCHELISRFRNRILWLRLIEKHGIERAREIKKDIKIFAGAGRPSAYGSWLGLRRPIDGPDDEEIDTVGEPVGEPEASMGLVVSPDGEVAS